MNAVEIMRRPAALLLAVLLACLFVTDARAEETQPVPAPNVIYAGDVSYRDGKKRIMLRTSFNGSRVRVAVGYVNRMRNCGARGGKMFADFVPSTRWLPVQQWRGKTIFEGIGFGATEGIEADGTQQAYKWEIVGEFTSSGQAYGNLIITGWVRQWNDRRTRARRTWSCPSVRTRWSTSEILDRGDVPFF